MFEGVVGELSGGVGRRVAVAGGPVKGHGAVTWRRERSGVRAELRRAPASEREEGSWPRTAGSERLVSDRPRGCCPRRGQGQGQGQAPGAPGPLRTSLSAPRGAESRKSRSCLKGTDRLRQ